MSYKILILHAIDDFAQERSTSVRHVMAIENYTSGNHFIYHHINHDVSAELRSIAFDIVVIDVTFLCWRWVRPREAFDKIREKYRWISELDAFRIALPQDDYDHASYLDKWLIELGVDCVYTCIPDHAEALYPSLLAKGIPIVGSYTGLIDAHEVQQYRDLRRDFASRDLDVGYRVRRLPANFGRLGIMKSELGRRFEKAAQGRLKVDISDAPEATLVGDNWPRFLTNCRFILGCESGASIIDYTGEIKDRVDAYMRDHPEAEFDEVYKNCIRATDERPMPAFPPRMFEIAMAGACPVLVEGDYNGLLKPNIHYIPIARDFSNLDEVIDRLSDHASAQAIARNIEDALLGNENFRYEGWVRGIMQRADEVLVQRPNRPTTSDDDFEKLARAHHRATSASLFREKRALISEHEIQIRELIATYSTEIARLNEIYPASLEVHRQAISDLEEKRKAEDERHRSETEECYAKIANYEAKINFLNEKYKTEISSLEQEIEKLDKIMQKTGLKTIVNIAKKLSRRI